MLTSISLYMRRMIASRPSARVMVKRFLVTMVTSNFRPEVEIWTFRACPLKNLHYNPYLWTNRQNSRVLQKNGIKKLMAPSDFRPDIEIWPFRTCAMNNTQFIHCGLGYGQILRSTTAHTVVLSS